MKFKYDCMKEVLPSPIRGIMDKDCPLESSLLEGCPSVSKLVAEKKINYSDSRVIAAIKELDIYAASEKREDFSILTPCGVLRNLLHYAVSAQLNMAVVD